MAAVRAPASVLAIFFAADLLLVGAAAFVPAVAEDQAPVTNKTDGEADPIDSRIIPQRPAHLARDHRIHDSKKSNTIHSSGYSGSRRIWFRGAKFSVVRNAIGLPIHSKRPDPKGTDVKGPEWARIDGVPKIEDPARNSSTGVGGIGPHGQGFIPVPHDPRVNTATNHLSISGHDVARSGSGTGAIGGPAKNLAGALNGTAFHPRHR